MLSDEDKKAIKYFYNLRATIDESNMLFDINVKCGNETIKQITLVLNLIEKQQKEIEELKNITKSYDSFLGNEKIVIADKKFFVNGYFQENFVRKEKIKAKIEEFKIVRDTILENEKEFNRSMMTYDLKRNDYCEKMLQSLLEKE